MADQRVTFWVSAAAIALGPPAAAQEREPEARKLRGVRIETRNVFAEREADVNWFYWFFNALHYPTDPEVVAREIWFEPGDRVSDAEIEELERNLRGMRLFGDVVATREDVGNDEFDLDVHTHDRFSLTVNGSVGLVGGVTSYSAAISESNLFGKGKRIGISARKDDIDESTQISYTDPQFLDGRHRLFLVGGATNEGPFALVQLTRPFRYIEDPRSYGGSLGYGERDVDYFSFGEVVASVPQQAGEVSAFVAHGFGPREARSTIGLDALFTDTRYGAAFGPAAALIPVPGDTREGQLGFTYTVDYAHSYRKETRIDTIDYIQDIQLGVGGRARVAGVLRDEDGVGTALEPLFEAELRSAIAPLPETYLTIDLSGSMRLNAGDLVGWRASTALHAYQKSLPSQTLAASLTFDGADETENLPVQLTLGEDNGLRGYPAREFAGDRYVRLNLEDRIFTGLEVLSVDIGLVAFFDVGWIHSELQGLSMSQAFRGTGFGLRLGSNELFGGRVLRIDLAWPLDSVPGQDYGVSLSFGSDQVFGFFGNQSELTTEF